MLRIGTRRQETSTDLADQARILCRVSSSRERKHQSVLIYTKSGMVQHPQTLLHVVLLLAECTLEAWPGRRSVFCRTRNGRTGLLLAPKKRTQVVTREPRVVEVLPRASFKCSRRVSNKSRCAKTAVRLERRALSPRWAWTHKAVIFFPSRVNPPPPPNLLDNGPLLLNEKHECALRRNWMRRFLRLLIDF